MHFTQIKLAEHQIFAKENETLKSFTCKDTNKHQRRQEWGRE